MKKSIMRFLCAAAVISAAVLAIGTAGAAVPDSTKFSGCGTLFEGTECILLETDDGRVYYPDFIGDFGPGDRVHIDGILDTECFNICLQGEGCIYVSDIRECEGTPTRETSWSRIKSMYR